MGPGEDSLRGDGDQSHSGNSATRKGRHKNPRSLMSDRTERGVGQVDDGQRQMVRECAERNVEISGKKRTCHRVDAQATGASPGCALRREAVKKSPHLIACLLSRSVNRRSMLHTERQPDAGQCCSHCRHSSHAMAKPRHGVSGSRVSNACAEMAGAEDNDVARFCPSGAGRACPNPHAHRPMCAKVLPPVDDHSAKNRARIREEHEGNKPAPASSSER